MLETENVLALADAARRLPKLGRRRHRPHVSTLWRWARDGVRGIRLEVRCIGRRLVTSSEALDRFAEALAQVPRPERSQAPAPPSALRSAARERSIARAERALNRAGI